jgi:hypothetical protein
MALLFKDSISEAASPNRRRSQPDHATPRSAGLRRGLARQSVRADQSAGLLRSQSPGHLCADVALEAADGRTGQWTKDAVHVPLVVTLAAQRILDPQPVRFGHTGLVGHGRHRWG